MDAAGQAELAQLLTTDEQRRAARLLAAVHSRRFVVAHARLRQQLAALLDVGPAEVQLAAGDHGKPRIDGELAQSGLEFNLSHSGSLGFIGWTWKRAVGVDIEIWRPVSDEAALARRFFSSSENAAYEQCAATERTRAFFNCWTRKEAYVKAVGRGLTLPLHSFDVSLGDDDPRLLRASAMQDDGRSWTLAAPQLDTGMSAAVVIEGAAFQIIPA